MAAAIRRLAEEGSSFGDVYTIPELKEAIILFVDDKQAQVMSPAAVQAIATVVVEAGDDNLLVFCPSKTVVMVVGVDDEAVKRGKLRLMELNGGQGPLFAGKPMKIVEAFTYLGIAGGVRGNGVPEMRKRAGRYGDATSAMMAAGVCGVSVSALMLPTILSGIGNKLAYAAAVWALEGRRLDKLDAVWAYGHIRAMRLNGVVPPMLWGVLPGASPPSWRVRQVRKAAMWLVWHSRHKRCQRTDLAARAMRVDVYGVTMPWTQALREAAQRLGFDSAASSGRRLQSWLEEPRGTDDSNRGKVRAKWKGRLTTSAMQGRLREIRTAMAMQGNPHWDMVAAAITAAGWDGSKPPCW